MLWLPWWNLGHCITSQHITSYHIALNHHFITSHQLTSRQHWHHVNTDITSTLTSHHITSHHITSHQINWHHTTSTDITSTDITSTDITSTLTLHQHWHHINTDITSHLIAFISTPPRCRLYGRVCGVCLGVCPCRWVEHREGESEEESGNRIPTKDEREEHGRDHGEDTQRNRGECVKLNIYFFDT